MVTCGNHGSRDKEVQNLMVIMGTGKMRAVLLRCCCYDVAGASRTAGAGIRFALLPGGDLAVAGRTKALRWPIALMIDAPNWL